MIRSRTLPALAAVVVLALAACGTAPADDPSATPTATIAATDEPSAAPTTSAAPTDAGPEQETVRLDGFAFDTEELTISAGTEVQFVNADGAAHTVTEGSDGVAASDPIIDEELQQNGVATFAFDEPGTYQITCLFHPSMNMTVIVE
jgi:plastocyanin